MKNTTFFKTSIAVCLTIMSMSLSSCICVTEDSPCYGTTHPKNDTTITSKVILTGRYLINKGGYCDQNGTVLIFENGDIFNKTDLIETSFACATKEGDVVSYTKKSNGEIILKSFVSPADDKQGAQ